MSENTDIEKLEDVCHQQQQKIEEMESLIQSLSHISVSNHEMIEGSESESGYEDYNLSEDEINRYYQ